MSVEFERFDGYWADSPKGKPAIKNIIMRYRAGPRDRDDRAAGADAPTGSGTSIRTSLPSINKMPYLQATRKELMRIGFLSIDAAGRTGADNPLTKLKVRQAIWHAIDRQTIADKLVTGGSRVPPAPCYPSQFGCDGDAAVKYDLRSGQGQGSCWRKPAIPTASTPSSSATCCRTWEAAVQNYLQAVGIRPSCSHMQVAAGIQRA